MMKMNNKNYYLIILTAMAIGAVIMAYMATMELRNEVVALREWKTSYESGYCPTCGAKLTEDKDNGSYK